MSAGTVELLTGPRPAGVAVIRLAGDGAGRFLAAHLRPPPREGEGTLGYHRLVGSEGGELDDVVLARLPGGVWELSVHGGPEIVRQVMGLARGAGLTEPGLPEATDVVGWVERLLPLARTELAVRTLVAQPGLGHLPVDCGDVLRTLLCPPRVVLYGLPNVGKSTLLNALVGRQAAIAAEVAGTTRDFVSAEAELAGAWGGVVVELVDTPGLRATSDAIEAEAMEVAKPVVAGAAVRVLVLDATRELTAEERAELAKSDGRRMAVWNKCDARTGRAGREGELWVSARTGEGVAALGEAIAARLGLNAEVPHRRHRLPVELGT